MSHRPMERIERFWQKFDRDPETGCWVWNASTTGTNVYGQFHAPEFGTQIAHRYAYLAIVGPIPPETPHLDHLCRNHLCVNPAHLEPVTQTENNRRTRGEMCAKGLHPLAGATLFESNGTRRCRDCQLAHHHTGVRPRRDCEACGRSMPVNARTGLLQQHVCVVAA